MCDTACIDHRGTPQHPARTLTLEKTEGAICVSVSVMLVGIMWFFILQNVVSYFFIWNLYQWGAAYCVRGGAERERLAMEVCYI